jgi:hypothetical protein
MPLVDDDGDAGCPPSPCSLGWVGDANLAGNGAVAHKTEPRSDGIRKPSA